MNTLDLARTAARRAIEIRRLAAVLRTDPVNVFDVAEDRLGVRVQFFAGSSFEGMFAKEQNTILVPSERPPGRRVFAAAHELGHWAFGHGTRIDTVDSISDYNASPEERLVNQFAGHFLMPSSAVDAAADLLRLNFADPDKMKIYEMAGWFGVGYSSLINHLTYSQQRFPKTVADELLKYQPKDFRAMLVPNRKSSHMVVASSMSPRIPLDLAVGDHLVLPAGTTHSTKHLITISSSGSQLVTQALTPGISLASNGTGWSAVIRIMKRNFSGWSKYRHLDDENDLD
jgi:Zn-dependent peptidase ImmA (M78 family)